MSKLKYLIQFILIILFLFIFRILGLKAASSIGGKIFQIIGPIFRSKKLIQSNIKKVFPEIESVQLNKITSSMWNNYGRVFAEYVFMKNFRNNQLNDNIKIIGNDILEEIKKNNQKVIFVSGHFSNFELMAMQIEKAGIKLAAIYRPLNNIFVNKIMERIRRKYICKTQIKKGIGGLKELLKLNIDGYSTALMIDQRVTEGILSKFFNEEALTTTIPAQIVKKFKTPIIPVYIERIEDIKFKIIIKKQLNFAKDETIQEITDKLNQIFEEMVLKNPEQWIWSHSRWK